MAELDLTKPARSADGSPGAWGDPLCVGRDAELTELKIVYDRTCLERVGRMALVVGPPGVGKTRLLGELFRGFRAGGVPIFEGACREGGLAYQPFVEVSQQLLAFLGEAGASDETLAHAADVLGALRGHGRRRGGLGVVRDGVDHRILFFEHVHKLFCDVSAAANRQGRAPVVLLHDLHAADGASLSLLAYLMRTLAPQAGLLGDDFCGLVVATSQQAAPEWIADVDARVIELGGLSLEGMRAYLNSPQVLERVLRASGGVPRRLEALLEQAPPDSEALVADKLAALASGPARLLRALALYGRPVGAALLERLSSALSPDDEKLGSDLHAHDLRSCPLLNRQVVGGELRLGFAHSSARAAVVRAISSTEMAELHRALGEALHAGLDAGEDATACAEHLLSGKAGERAVDVAIGAGELLERAFAYERAISLYEQALATTERAEAAALLEDRLADLHQLTGDYGRALEVVARVAGRRPGDARVLARIGHLTLMRGDFAAARVALQDARRLAEASGDRPAQVQILADLAECHFLDGQKHDALAIGGAAVALAGDDPEAARGRMAARNSLGKVNLEHGDYQQAAQLFAQNLQEARASGLLFDVSRAHINLGICALRRGDDAAAETSYRAGLAAAREHGDVRHRAFCLQNLGVLAQWRRDYAAALHHYQDAAQAFKRLGHRPWLAWVAIDLGDLYLGLGDTERGAVMADLAERLLGDVPTAKVILDNLRGRIALDTGDLPRARALLETALETARRIGNKDELSLNLLNLARLELADGNDAEASLRRLAEIPAPCSARVNAPLLVAQGEARLALGNCEAARADLVAGERAYAELADDEGRVRALILGALAAEAAGDARAARQCRGLARDLDQRLRARVPAEFAASYGRDPLRAALFEAPRPMAGARRDAASGAAGPGSAAASAGAAPAGPGAVAPAAAGAPSRFPRIVGRSAEIVHLLEMVGRVAPHDTLVMIRGESGTGKELIAEAIHEASPRRSRPFVKVNCGALVESLLLSELFGHERGAFTGALQRRKGRFEAADGGTLFLDEIGDISPQTQVALLRVLQTHEFERVGGTQPIRVDVRIVCATNRDLEAMVAAGRFREDLYYRLKGIELDLPPLRARPADIPLLARHFLARIAEERGTAPKPVASAALDALVRHPWPGNIRELENVIRSVTLFTDADEIGVNDLGEYLGGVAASAASSPGPAPAASATVASAVARDAPEVRDPVVAATHEAGSGEDALSDIYGRALASGLSLRELKRRIELECITRALADSGGNITRAAEKLGMKRPRLSQLIKEHGIAQRGTEERQ
jgi:DNA-binding NtrC family response regulator/tetratricopeptide (TPR) repeat protein